MGSPVDDLSDWVAVKDGIFSQRDEQDHARFICAWNEEASKLAVTLHEGSRKASDQRHKNKVCLLSMKDLYLVHQQCSLICTSLNSDFPKEITPKYKPSRKRHEYISKIIEHYLSNAVKAIGKKMVSAIVFGDDDPLTCYEENWQEFKQKTLEGAVDKVYKELEEIMKLRARAESLLQLTTVYALEDEVCKNLSEYLSELYSFNLKPFLELREMSQLRVKQSKCKLSEEIGPNIRRQAEKEFEEWNEQSLVATEAIQQLYQEFYRKTLNLYLGARDRMIVDKKKYGKVAFELHGIPRLLKLEVQVCQEDLKLHNSVKATREYQRDKIKNQLTFLNHDYGAVRELERIAEEIASAQIGVYDSHLDVLEKEECLYKSQLGILNKEFKDNVELGVFYDAVENPEDLDDVDNDGSQQNPRMHKLKQKLCKIYRKRAVIRNKKKNLVTEIKQKKSAKAMEVDKNEKIAQITRQRKESKAKELPADKLATERKKTLQRLKEYKKKTLQMEAKYQDENQESSLTTSTLTVSEDADFADHAAVKIVSKRNKSIKQKTEENPKTETSKPALVPPPVPDASLPSIPPPPIPPPLSMPPPPPLSIPPPPPPPPPPPSIPPPPPPPPPPLLNPSPTKPSSEKPANVAASVDMEISQMAISERLSQLKKPTPVEPKKVVGNPFSLNEILMMRNKLKPPPPETADSKGHHGPMDLSSILQATMKRIRNITEDSDPDSDSSYDFD